MLGLSAALNQRRTLQRLDLFYRDYGTVDEKVEMHRLPWNRYVQIVASRLYKEPHGKL